MGKASFKTQHLERWNTDRGRLEWNWPKIPNAKNLEDPREDGEDCETTNSPKTKSQKKLLKNDEELPINC
jgi:hypothetical protein